MPPSSASIVNVLTTFVTALYRVIATTFTSEPSCMLRDAEVSSAQRAAHGSEISATSSASGIALGFVVSRSMRQLSVVRQRSSETVSVSVAPGAALSGASASASHTSRVLPEPRKIIAPPGSCAPFGTSARLTV